MTSNTQHMPLTVVVPEVSPAIVCVHAAWVDVGHLVPVHGIEERRHLTETTRWLALQQDGVCLFGVVSEHMVVVVGVVETVPATIPLRMSLRAPTVRASSHLPD